MAQSVTCLSSQHEDLSLNSTTTYNLDMVASTTPVLGKQRQTEPTHWLASLAELLSCWFGERLCFENYGRWWSQKTSSIDFWPLHACTHICTVITCAQSSLSLSHTHTYLDMKTVYGFEIPLLVSHPVPPQPLSCITRGCFTWSPDPTHASWNTN